MSSELTYGYASGDLLENRNTYFYTQFQGCGFLDAWRSQRNEALQFGEDKEGASPRPGIATPTAIALERVLRDVLVHGADAAGLAVLDRYVQRFEVTKRLHAEYGPNWRPTNSEDYRALEAYVLFGEAVQQAYACTQSLPYLNALLKCVDTLTSVRGKLEPGQVARLRNLVRAERAHVERLASVLAEGSHDA